jgi:hypothetical protein
MYLNKVTDKSKIGNAINLGQYLEFDVAFPGEVPLNVEQYLKGGSKSIILNVAAFFLGFKSYNSKYRDHKKLLEAIFGPENNDFAADIYNNIHEEEQKGVRIGIVNTYSSLKLFEYFFSREDQQETQSEAEFERNLFKAYLILNTEFTNRQKAAFTSTQELEGDLKISMMMFCLDYPVSDKSNYDLHEIWATQTIKSIYLFEFLESTAKTKTLLTAFLAHFNSPTWQEYLKEILSLTSSAIKNEHEAHTDIIVEPGKKFLEGCAFIEKLIVHENEDLNENDFLTVRARPFYKIKDGVYRIIFNLFVVEKIFKGVYFFLREINDQLPGTQKLPSIKGVYTYEFSEQTLLYKIIDIIYPNKEVKFSGKQLADMHIDGAPDYYVRKGKNILVFESKDFLIRADKKASFDFNIYEEEFRKTLYYEELPNGKEKAGAVMQLIRSIKEILQNKFKLDTAYYYKDVFIYPVLITHDHQYDTPGFNDLIKFWLQEELLNLQDEGLFIHHVKPIVVVNIDSLVFHQAGLAESIPLHEMINIYNDYTQINRKLKFETIEEYEEYRLSKLIPFSLFISRYFDTQGIWKLPPVVEVVAPTLFREEFEND